MGKTNIKGDTAELKVAARYLELGYWVSFPVGEDTPYDLVIDNGKELKTVQVKHITESHRKDGSLLVRLQSSTGKSYKELVDIIAVYNPEWGMFALNMKDFPKSETMISLRMTPAKNGQKDVWLAKDYVL